MGESGAGERPGRTKKRSAIGKTNSPSAVEETIPPMTTVASGRCTSAPAWVEIAIGMNPNAATSAVVTTGRKTVAAENNKLTTRQKHEI